MSESKSLIGQANDLAYKMLIRRLARPMTNDIPAQGERIDIPSMGDNEKVYWVPDTLEEQKGLCTLNDPEKRYRVYAKWDDMLHFWFYEDEYMFDCDTGALGPEARKSSHHSYYWCIGGPEELDDMIARLQAIKPAVQEWYAKRGERWPPDWKGYASGKLTIEQATTLEQKYDSQEDSDKI